ncbi:MAG: NAD(P)H-dependent oxidoreductase, partial [Alkalibacterium gilvum]|nr:NAD(P)H-dependent oxidoreductase [Alkalibacterium sp.]
MKHLIGLVGTNSSQSTNRKLLQFIQMHFQEEATVELMEIKDFPVFNKPSDSTL